MEGAGHQALPGHQPEHPRPAPGVPAGPRGAVDARAGRGRPHAGEGWRGPKATTYSRSWPGRRPVR
jgi:hypothetical protein